MTKKHWAKFFWADWEADEGLRQCSLAAQGLWMRMLCLCAKGEPYGYLTIRGEPLGVEAIAKAASVAETEAAHLIAELERWAVFSRDRSGRIYSRRMVRDEKKSNTARNNGLTGGSPLLKSSSDNPPLASGSWSLASLEEKFEEFWKAYPKRLGANPRKPALESYLRAIKCGQEPEKIIAGARKYAAAESKNVGTPYIAQAVTWLNQQRWGDYANGGGEVVDLERMWAIKCERGAREEKPEGAWGAPPEFISKWKASRPPLQEGG